MSKLVQTVTRKSLKIKESGRSSDYITPSFGHGCLLECSYCYMKRNKPKGLTIANNIGEILSEINTHAYFYADPHKPNQTHPKYITYDLSCNEDFALHMKYHDWVRIFQFFVDHPKAMGTFATKIVPKDMLGFHPQQKIRIRFSLMPQTYADFLEPNTASIISRIMAVNDFIKAGYDVHLNFSPVILRSHWEDEYVKLFKLVNSHVRDEYKEKVLAEVIFLTHNVEKHKYNMANNIPGEDLLWSPGLQEAKISQHGGKNLRYKHDLKRTAINRFKYLHNKEIPWNKIRYIF